MRNAVAIYGYHGTYREAAAAILESGKFIESENEYDWLGMGVYFFQDAPIRAWEFARDKHHAEAAVVGAEIRLNLDECIDLLDITWERPLLAAYESLRRQSKLAKQPFGKVYRQNRSGRHELDCAVINLAVELSEPSGVKIRAVRSTFREVDKVPIFNRRSALYSHAHVQIAVRDQSCIGDIWREVRDNARG